MSHRTDLEEVVDFMLFSDTEGRLEHPHVDKMRNAGLPPQTWLDIVAEQMESIGTPQAAELAERLRRGEGDKYVAARLGYV